MDQLRGLQAELVIILASGSDFLADSRLQGKIRLNEVLRSIAEMVAYGEAAEQPMFFEYFCEKDIMTIHSHNVLCIDNCCPQVIQAISVLIQNIHNPTSLYMLLSKDHINRLIDPDRGLDGVGGVSRWRPAIECTLELAWEDEEFLSHYVALLKAISVRLSPETVQFFVNASEDSFPLYTRTVPHITNSDPMV
ncbi:unnamed protein product, partial [Choristocarpus tenellus]